jgi:hypothetical protein
VAKRAVYSCFWVNHFDISPVVAWNNDRTCSSLYTSSEGLVCTLRRSTALFINALYALLVLKLRCSTSPKAAIREAPTVDNPMLRYVSNSRTLFYGMY